LRRRAFIRAALRASALFACALSLLASAADARTTDAEAASVRWALDGDSLLLADGRQVRLIGINTPELGKNGAADQPLARAARERATALTRGQTIRLVYDRERLDRYGRTLAYAVLPDGRDLQDILLREGYAWFIAIPPNVSRLPLYRSAESHARTTRLGVWGRPEYEPVSAERVSPAQYGFLRLSGTVMAIRNRATGVEVALSPRVHLWLPRDVYASLPARQSLLGKRVLARGWLAEYKYSARMRITHPAMLEVL
jgi:micrococcal nuclease